MSKKSHLNLNHQYKLTSLVISLFWVSLLWPLVILSILKSHIRSILYTRDEIYQSNSIDKPQPIPNSSIYELESDEMEIDHNSHSNEEDEETLYDAYEEDELPLMKDSHGNRITNNTKNQETLLSVKTKIHHHTKLYSEFQLKPLEIAPTHVPHAIVKKPSPSLLTQAHLNSCLDRYTCLLIKLDDFHLYREFQYAFFKSTSPDESNVIALQTLAKDLPRYRDIFLTQLYYHALGRCQVDPQLACHQQLPELQASPPPKQTLKHLSTLLKETCFT